MEKIKARLFSEEGKRLVNALFCISAIFRKTVFSLLACLAWLAYLLFCIKQAETKGSKIIYGVFFGIAAVLVCVNLFYLLQG